MKIKCVASINDVTTKLRRLIVDRSKVAFFVPTGLVKKDISGRFGGFKASI